MRIGADAKLINQIRTLATRATGVKQSAVSRGLPAATTKTMREIQGLPLPAAFQVLQNRDGTMNR